MADNNDEGAQPTPDPALRRLQRLVGTWELTGHAVGSDEHDIKGTTTFRWLHGDDGPSFFLLQEMELDYAGTLIRSHELIGCYGDSKRFSSYVYSNMASDPWPYEWNIDGDDLTISVTHGPMNARYTGKFAPDGNSFSGGWRPNPGADETINAPYDIVARRIR